jgi:hypothetical protein
MWWYMCQQFGGTYSEVGGSKFLRNAAKFLHVCMNPHPQKKAAFFVSTVVVTLDFTYILPVSLNPYYTILDTSCRVQLVIHVCIARDCEVPLV